MNERKLDNLYLRVEEIVKLLKKIENILSTQLEKKNNKFTGNYTGNIDY